MGARWLVRGSAACAWVWAVGAAAVAAQPSDRLWGTVHTVSGAVHEGWLRWDRNEAAWADVLDGQKAQNLDLQDQVAELLGAELDERGRAVEYLGVRISWDDDGPLPGSADAGIRFGHLAWLRPTSGGSALLGLKSGEEVELLAAGTDLGDGLRSLRVDTSDGRAVDLAWRELDRIDFGAAPAGSRPGAAQLWGTVEDRWGDRWTGYVSWDRDEVLGTDVLDGTDEDGRDREIPFDRIAAVEPLFEGGARVVLRDGGELVLRGTNDVDDGHRGIQVADPGLGEVSVEWRDVASVRFSTSPATAGYDDFRGGAVLRGTVTTDAGETFTGSLYWDADERFTWELLDGSARDLAMKVEFGLIERISRLSSRRARVVLRDGRVLELEGSNDVDEGNKGIVVELDDGTLQVVEWDRFDSVVFADPAGSVTDAG